MACAVIGGAFGSQSLYTCVVGGTAQAEGTSEEACVGLGEGTCG